jgi:O-antigen/teichoic acid export membrane protein
VKSTEGQRSDAEPFSARELRGLAVTGVMSIAVRGVVTRGLGLVGSLVLARLLTPSDFGAIAFGYTLITFGAFMTDGGIGATLIRRREDPTTHELRSLLGFVLITSLGAVALIAAIGLALGRTGVLATIMALSLPVLAFKVPTAITAERKLFYRPLVRADIAQVAVYNVAAVGLVAAGLGVWGLAIGMLVSALAGTIILLAIGPTGFLLPAFSLRTVRPFLSFGLAFQAVNVVNTLRDQGLNVLTAAVGGLSVLGIWSLANRVLQGIMLVLESVWRVSFPAISRLIETGERPEPSIERALALTTAFTGFAAVALGGTAPALVPIAFGARWEDVVPVLPWAAAGILIAGPISTSAVGLFYARNRPRVPLGAVLAHTATWFAVTTPLLPALGAEALGIGWFAGAIVDAVILGRALSNEGVHVVRQWAPPVIVALGAATVGWLVATTVRPHAVGLAASLVSVEILYLTGMLVVRRAVVVDLYRMLRGTLMRRSRIEIPAAR